MKKTTIAVIALTLILGGCSGEGENVSPEQMETTVTTTEKTTVAATEEITEAAREISDEQRQLEELIISRAKETDMFYEEGVSEIQSPIFGDFDGDGKNELIAVYGDSSDSLFEDFYPGGCMWFASGDSAVPLRDGTYMTTTLMPPEIITSAGHIFLKQEACGGTDSCSYYYEIENSAPVFCNINGYARQGLRPDGDSGDFTAVHSTYDFNSDGTGHTWKKYWLYYVPEEHAFYPYEGSEMTLDELLEFKGAAERLDKAKEDGFEIREIYRRDNGIINVNLREYSDETDPDGEAYYSNFFINFKAEVGSATDITDGENEGYYLP